MTRIKESSMKNLFFGHWLQLLQTPVGSTIFKEGYRGDKYLAAAALTAVQFTAECNGQAVRTISEIIQYVRQHNDPVGKFLEEDNDLSSLDVERLSPRITSVPEESFGEELLARVREEGFNRSFLPLKSREVLLSLMSNSCEEHEIKSAIFYGFSSAELAFSAASRKIRSRFITPYKEWAELFTAVFSRFVGGFLTCDDEMQSRQGRADAFFSIAEFPAPSIPPELKRQIFRGVDGPIFFLSPKNGMGFFRTEKERRDFIEEFRPGSVVDLGGNIFYRLLVPFYLIECPGERQKKEINFIYFPKLPRKKNGPELDAWAHHCESFLRGDPQGTGVEEVSVPLSKVEVNQWKIFPPLYHTSIEKKKFDQFISGLETIDLGKGFDIIRCQPLSRFTTEAHTSDSEQGLTAAYEIRLSHVESTGEVVVPEASALKLPSNQLSESRLSRQVLHPGDVLLGVLGSVGKIAVVTDVPGNARWLASQAFAVLRPKGHRSGESAYLLGLYLFLYLRSEIVWNYLLSSADEGGGAKSLSFDVLKKLPFIIPSEKDLVRAEEDYRRVVELNDQIKRMQKEIERILTVNLTNRIAEEKHQGEKGKK